MRAKQATLVVVGMFVCLIASISHSRTSDVSGFDLPWGTALGLIAAYASACTADFWVRIGGAFFGLGWALGLTLPMLVPGESYLIGSDWLGLLFMFGGFGALALAIVQGDRAHRLDS